MINVSIQNNFQSWRVAARRFLSGGIPPDQICWSNEEQGSLFSQAAPSPSVTALSVPAEFIKLATAVACFDNADKWPLLYRILYRLKSETRHLLEIESDADVRAARTMEKSVNRDVHKFHAFVRFRRVDLAGEELFVAWHEPQHFTVERSTPFFARRFGSMKFSILTPKGSAHWDLSKLTFSAAATREMAPGADETEDFWRLYYRSIFNPFRLNVKAMKKELPVRHWPTLPEAPLIAELIREGQAKSEPISGISEQRSTISLAQ
ncbi:MAG: TIGR03915 family putative DNA repair protein [Pyrinomonadaceae bacterium]